jgi:hypothetical protein
MLELLWVGIIGMMVGLVAGLLLLVRAVKKAMDQQETETIQMLAERITNQLVFLKVDHTPDLLLAYDAISGDFVCQGATMEDLTANFGLRYPNKKGILVEPEKGEAHELV